MYIDPSGYTWLSNLGDWFGKNWKSVIIGAGVAALTVWALPAAVGLEGAMAVGCLSGMAGGFAGGFASAAFSGASFGQSLLAGYCGGIGGGLGGAFVAGAISGIGSLANMLQGYNGWTGNWRIAGLARSINDIFQWETGSLGSIISGTSNGSLAAGINGGGLGGFISTSVKGGEIGGNLFVPDPENVYFMMNPALSMEKQLTNTCVTSIMEYANHAFGGNTDQGVFDSYYIKTYRRNIYFKGVDSEHIPSFVEHFFTTENFTSFNDAINSGQPVMTDMFVRQTAAGIDTHNVLIIGFNRTSGNAIYMDPQTGTVNTNPLSLFKKSYAIPLKGIK